MASPEIERAIPENLVPPDCAWPIVLGIDPGTRIVGYGAVVAAPRGPRFLACGAIRAGNGSVPERLARIRDDVELLLTRLRPGVVAVEDAFAAVNVRSALRIGEGRGVVLAAAAGRGCQVAQYAPSVAKKAVLGHGAGSKEQVRAMVTTILRMERAPELLDATDALSLALAHVSRMGLLDALGRGV